MRVNNAGKECICRDCGKKYIYNRNSHGLTICGSCRVNKRRFANKIRAVEYLGGCCSKCGYDENVVALDFHHVDRSTKEFTISGMHCLSWKRIKAELDKCVLLCANCHRVEEFSIKHGSLV